MNLGELFVKLGVKSDTKGLDSFGKGLQTVSLKMAGAIAGITAGLWAMDKFTAGTIKSSVALQNFESQTGLSMEKLQQWQFASQLSDVNMSAEQVTNTIKNLQKNLTDISLGKGNIAGFQMLGIDAMGKDAFQVLDQVRHKIKGLKPAMATNLIQQMGIDPAMINVLKLSDAEFSKLSSNRFLSREQHGRIIELGTAITKFKLEMKLSRDEIVANLAPAFMKIVGFINNLSAGFRDVVNYITPMTGLLKGLGVVAGIVALKFFPITGAILGLLLVLEDLYVFSQGGDSLFGDFVNSIKSVLDPIKEYIENIKELFASIKKLKEDPAGAIKDAGKASLSAVGNVFAGIKEFLIKGGLGAGPAILTKMAERGVNQVNNYFINSKEDAQEIANQVAERQIETNQRIVAQGA